MKEITTLRIRQDWDEPQLRMRIYRGDKHFYIRLESDDPRMPPSMPMRIKPANFKDAKREAEKLLRLIRGVFREALGKSQDLPQHTKKMEPGIPAFLQFLLNNNPLGEN
jgi:hypothetical protein